MARRLEKRWQGKVLCAPVVLSTAESERCLTIPGIGDHVPPESVITMVRNTHHAAAISIATPEPSTRARASHIGIVEHSTPNIYALFQRGDRRLWRQFDR